MLRTIFCANISPPLQKQAIFSLLKSSSSQPNQLKEIHALLLTTGISIKNSLITQLLTSLILLGDMTYARKLFDEMHKPRPFIWNTLIKGYVKNELVTDAISLYRRMDSIGVRPDRFTFPFVIKGCGELNDIRAGMEVHVKVIKFGFEFDSVVRTELMIMYSKFGEMGIADYVFESMLEKDLVVWNALILANVQNGRPTRSLELFHEMGLMGIKADSVTFVSVLSACANLGSLEMGKEIDSIIVEEKLERNLIVNNARLDMYSKCGSMDLARNIFEEMPKRNVISWSIIIGGYAINGDSQEALTLFSRMRDEGLKPNHVTFLGVLAACSHAGLVKEGKRYFDFMVMSNNRDIQPRIEHYSCMVDILGRSGDLDGAYEFIKRMPIQPDPGVWGALLGACTIYQNIELGQKVADCLFELAPKTGSYHVLLSNIYATARRWDDVKKVRQNMRQEGIKKVAAYSSVELNNKIHVFHGGDRSHEQSKRIYEVLEDLVKKIRVIGYLPKVNVALHDVEMEERETAVGTHSEKLAIAFGLINLRPDSPIRVMKNLRVCDDCHNFCKLVSRITKRTIVMRDKNVFHHFKEGVCSCKDFW